MRFAMLLLFAIHTELSLSLPPSLLSPAESTQQRDVTRRDTDIYDSWCAPYPLS